MGELRMTLASLSFPCTRSTPTIDRLEVGARVQRSRTGLFRDPSKTQTRSSGSVSATESEAACPSQIRVVFPKEMT